VMAGCKDDDDDDPTPTPTDMSKTFKVTVQNVSTPTTLEPGAMLGGLPDRTAPLSHGPWAIYSTSNDLFTVGSPSSEGTSRVAEDGITTVITNDLNNSSWVKHNGEFVAPGGPDNGSAIFYGETSMFMVTAEPGDKLQIESMFVQSNDWFYSFGNGGLPLFNGTTPVNGDMTSYLVLYDAGTELDEPPGLGNTQKPDQDPLDTNIGPDDSVNQVQPVETRHPGLTVPPVASVIKITVVPQ
jgi:hypothetical protein